MIFLSDMTPSQLLTIELKGYKKALKKSVESYNNRQIDFDTHNKHVRNLNSLIFQYEQAIKKLRL